MTTRFGSIWPLLLMTVALWSSASTASGLNETTFVPEPARALPHDAAPAPPLAHRRLAPRSASHHPARPSLLARLSRITGIDSVAALTDNYVQDGWSSAVAINPSDPTNCLMAFEEGWDFDPDIPLGALRDGASSWAAAVFPVGSGIYAGIPSEPWAVAGNDPGKFYSSMLRQDLFPTDNTHTILAKSTDGGTTFTKAYELQQTIRQDRPMFDIDRPASLGGTTGAYDDRLYLCYDNWGAAGAGYLGSFLQVLVGDSLFHEYPLSGTGTPPFRGAQFQPVAGLNDGQILLVSNSILSNGAVVGATFHEMTLGGATAQFSKSNLFWAPAGQKLGASTHWGVNGHRIDERGSLALDRSFGVRRGHLYFITNRNPNPAGYARDQGDLYLSTSVTRGSTWSTARIPTQSGKTQFFPMIDVDAQGWIHVAYYQNEAGYLNGGVLNAGQVAVYYTLSRDGGKTWTPPTRVNEEHHALNMEDPPLGLASFDYELLGDYMQLRATGTGDQTSVYVGWAGYDQYRADDGVGTKKQRLYATLVVAPAAPGATPGQVAGLAGAMAVAGALALYLRRRRA